MPQDNEHTTRFKVDISQLKSGIQEANRQIRLANAEFKAASAGMENWGKSTDGLKAKITQLETVLNSEKQKLSNLKDQLALTEAEYGTNSRAADELRIAIANQQAAVSRTERSLGDYRNRLSDLEDAQSDSEEAAREQNSAYKQLKETIAKQESDLQKLKNQYSSVVLTQGESSDEAQELRTRISELNGELQDNRNDLSNAEQAADELTDSLEEVEGGANTASGGFTVMKGALANLVADGIRKAVDGLKELVTNSIEVGKQFDTSMSQVQAVSGASGDELQMLRDKAKEMGASTKFSASEAADAFNYMAMAGWKTEDMMSGIEGVLNLAAASGADLATTSDIVTDALTAMGYQAGDAGRLADVMAAASSNANTNVEMMGETFKYAAPVVGAMGYTMEDTAVAIGLMANAGIKSTQAGTSLRSILSRLAAPPKAAASAMDELGLSITNSSGEMKPFAEIMDELRVKFADLSEAEQAKMAKDLAGQEAMSGLLAIVNAAPSDYEKLTEAVKNSEGAALSMSETMQDNLGGDMTKLSSNLESLQLMLYEKFEPALRKGVDALSSLVDAFKWMMNNGEDVKMVIEAIALSIGTYVAYTTAMKIMKEGFMALTIVTKAQAAAQWLLNAAMSANPIGIILALIPLLVTAFVMLWNKSESFRQFWIDMWEALKETVGEVVAAITKFFSGAWDKVKKVWSGATKFFSGIWDSIKKTFSNVGSWFSDKFTKAKNGVQSAWSTTKGFFKESWDGIKSTFSNTDSWFKDKFSKAKDNLQAAWNLNKAFFKKSWEFTKSVYAKTDSWFGDKFGDAWKAIKDKFAGWADFWSGLWTKIKDKFSDIGSNIGSAISDTIKSGLNRVLEHVENSINKGIGLINSAIGLANKLPGVNVGNVPTIKLPRLKQGGVLAKGQIGLLEGDGAEAVVPLENNKKWISKTARDLKASLQAEGLLASASSAQNVTNNYNFTQNNTSPKALSRLDIYRQTKNQLKFARGV